MHVDSQKKQGFHTANTNIIKLFKKVGKIRIGIILCINYNYDNNDIFYNNSVTSFIISSSALRRYT